MYYINHVYMPDILPAGVQRFMSIYPSALQVYIIIVSLCAKYTPSHIK